MSEDINLASQKAAVVKIKKVANPLLYIFIGVTIIALGLVVYSFFLSTVSDSLANDITKLKSNLSKSSKKQKMQIVSERLAEINNILSSRSPVNTITSKIVTNVPIDFSIDSISGNAQEISLSLSSNDLSAFANYLEKQLMDLIKTNKSIIQTIKINSFAQSKEGYTMVLNFRFNH